MRIVITGAHGFIGRNLAVHLAERGEKDVVSVTRETSEEALNEALCNAEFVYHLAGVNRPSDPADFDRGNRGFTQRLVDILAEGRRPPVVYVSSTQAALDNVYGRSKLAGEEAVERYASATGARTHVMRLPNVFGKWARPNYNSAVATFCHNIAHGLPITVNDPAAPLSLVYIDDVVELMLGLLAESSPSGPVAPSSTYKTTVGEIAQLIGTFADSRRTLVVPPVGTGLLRALHATYLSYLQADQFTYPLTRHADPRGVFVEMLRTTTSGQFSYFTAHPGITRGEHYHHSKTEKFLVVSGTASFGFRNILTGEQYEITVDGNVPTVVETVPGWAHNVKNVGAGEMIVLLWANEMFDPSRPDTIAAKVTP